jgi:hypothetical protein
VLAGLVLGTVFTATDAQSVTHYVQVVNPADPGLVWAAPQAIPVGTALGPSQLSATAATPGSFVYQPGPGALLGPGNYTLSVAFTPFNPNYSAASGSVPLTVTPGFQFQFASVPTSGSPIVVTPLQPATVGLTVQPLIQSSQPITFKCSVIAGVTCAFSPSTVQLSTSTVPVTLTISDTPTSASSSLVKGRGERLAARHHGPGPAHPDGRHSAEAAGGMARAALLLCLLCLPPLRRGRLHRPSTSGARCAIALLALTFGAALFGCGWGHGTGNGNGGTLTVTASSALESHSVSIPVTTP